LRETKYFILTKQPQTKAGAAYGDANHVDGPVELIAAQGLLVDGALHLHGTMCDDHGRTFGGHMLPEGNPVLVTCEVSIHDAPGLACVRGDDGEVDGMQFFPNGL
jgi:predicted DNA-binding protein with PD1-like motif